MSFDAADARAALFDGLLPTPNVEHLLATLEADLSHLSSGGSAAPFFGAGGIFFCGPPGTGKTTFARRFGALFKRLGVLPTDKVVETTSSDLIGAFVGSSRALVEEKMQRAEGGILLIDGLAHFAGAGPYGADAVGALVSMCVFAVTERAGLFPSAPVRSQPHAPRSTPSTPAA